MVQAKTPLQEFEFIVSDGPQIPEDPKIRTIIRKQAMRDVVVERKKRGSHRRANTMKYRVVDSGTDTSTRTVILDTGASGESPSLDSRTSFRAAKRSATEMTVSRGVIRFDQSTTATGYFEEHQTVPHVPTVTLTNGYEALRSKYQFDITDLCLLTSFHVGQGTMSAMARDPDLLRTILGKQMGSYLYFLPSRYGHKPYLTAVVDCLIAKAHGTLHPHDTKISARVLRMYGQALKAVQTAISDEEASLDADLLCAVQMLSFYEILKPGPTSSYAHHTEGTANLIRHRSPKSFKTPYEQALLMAHMGPAFTEAFYRGEPCYLEQPEWMALYTSFAEETAILTDRSPLIIRIRKSFVRLSGFFVDTSRALSVEGQSDPGFLLALELKIRATHQDLLGCLEDYKAYVDRTASTRSQVSDSALEHGALGTILLSLCVYKRMLAALSEADRLRLEAECQALVVLMIQRHERPSTKHSWVHTDIEHDVALLVQMTSPCWQENLTGQSFADQRLASFYRWEAFRGYTSMYCQTSGKGVSERSSTPVVALSEPEKERWT